MSDYLPPRHPDQPEEVLPDLPESIANIPEDRPRSGDVISSPEPLKLESDSGITLPPVILGCATFGYGIYQDQAKVVGELPVQMVKLALRSGITAFDTAPHYHPSELILGRALSHPSVRAEFPRESYRIITKTAKFGPMLKDHVYDPEVVKKSIERSLRRLNTGYLDVVYLHDIEFVVSSPVPTPSGHHLEALDPSSPSSSTHHLQSAYTPLGAGDESILSCLSVLREFQKQGKILQVGISAFPLPVLLRIARLVKSTTGKGLDIVQCYAHQTLLNSALEEGYLAAFEAAEVGTIVNAAPLAMGILTTGGGPEWHPARAQENASVFEATREAVKLCNEAGATLEEVASDYGYREIRQNGGKGKVVPVVIGCKDLSEIHRTLESYGRVKRGEGKWEEVGEKCRALFKERGADGWTWESPSKAAFD